MPQQDRRIFGPQHWNAIAKDLRTEYELWLLTPTLTNPNSLERRRGIEDIALRFAMRFSVDNSDFDPVKWLNQCSPDPQVYDFGELWKEPNATED